MIFGPKLSGLVLAGKKTETRRLVRTVKPGATKLVGPKGRRREVAVRVLADGVTVHPHYRPRTVIDQEQIVPGSPPPLTHTGRYPVQRGRGRPAEGHVIVTSVEQARLGDLTQRDAMAEGFATRAAFLGYWADLHAPDPLSTGAAVALRHLADAAPHPLPLRRTPAVRSLEHRGLARFDERTGRVQLTPAGADAAALPPPGPDPGTAVWVIRFHVDTATTPRLLAPASRPDTTDDLGYTERRDAAIPDEPEVLEPLDENWQKLSAARHAATRAGQTQELSRIDDLADRLRAAKHHASQRGADVRDDIRAIERRIIAIERKADRDAA